MTRFTNSVETGYADGTAVTTANSDDNGAGAALLALSGAATYSTTTPHKGALNYRLPVGTSGNLYVRGLAGPAGTTLAGRGYLLIESNALTGTTQVLRGLNGSTAMMFGLRLTTGLIPSITNGGGGVMATGSTALSLNTWYRLEFWVTPGTTTSTGRMSVDLYQGEDTITSLVHYDTVAGNAGTAQTPRSVEWGRSSTAAGAFTMRVDDLALDDGIGETYIGPTPDPSLTGSIAITSDAVGVISAARPLAGSADAVSNAVGTLSAQRPLTGSAAIVSGASGAIGSVSLALTGSIAITSGASGVIGARRPLTGAAAAVSDALGTLGVGKPLTGTIPIVSAAAGVISAQRPLTGSAPIVSGAAGVMDVNNPALYGTAAIVSGAAGSLGALRPLVGTAAIISGAAGTLGAYRPLAGSAPIVSNALGVLSARRPLDGSIAIVSNALGVLSAAKPLYGAVAIVSTATGEIGVYVPGLHRVYYWRGEQIEKIYHGGEEVLIL